MTESSPEREVTLTLLDYTAEISVTDVGNQPVSTATLTATSTGAVLNQATPGVFTISSKEGAPGDAVFVLASGHVASCVRGPVNATSVAVVLQPAVRTVVEVQSSVPYGVIPGQIVVPGVACPITLSLLPNEAIAPEKTPTGEVISRFVVTQLPATAGMVFLSELTTAPIPLSRTPEGVVVIRQFRK